MGAETTIALHGVKWTDDVPVWGTVAYDATRGRASLVATLADGRKVTASWTIAER